LAHAYTPGLKVAADVRLVKRRQLPLEGTVLVEPGRRVAARDEVARAELPGRVHPLNLANQLGVAASGVPGCMLKGEGEQVEAGEVIAATNPWLRFLRSRFKAPVAGTIESISHVTGQVMLREAPRAVVVNAYVSGTVVEVMPGEGADVETRCALAQGIFGVGGEQIGRLAPLEVAPDAPVGEEDIPEDCKGEVLVGGALVELPALRRAEAAGALGFITGGISAHTLQELLGYEIGVAVTGSEPLGTTLIVTEGFGRIPMARRTAELLKGLGGREVSINGATQIRAGVMRPEIIVPIEGAEAGEAEPAAEGEKDGIREGDEARIIRAPHFGRIGRVSRLVPEATRIETEAKVRVLEIELDDGTRLTVPRANVEVVER
jgi:hypothetical protein